MDVVTIAIAGRRVMRFYHMEIATQQKGDHKIITYCNSPC